MAQDFLNDYTFLLKVNQYRVRENWAIINVLDFENEDVLASFEGKVVSGNMSIAANSATRRTGSLSVIFSPDTYNILDINNLIAIDKKIEISIGLTNPFYNTEQYKKYGKVLWFKQGRFIITQASSSVSVTGLSVSVNFIDKSGFLNGVCGGTFPASVSFHEQIDIDQNEDEIISHPLIYDIIKEAVHHFGNEHYSRIIVEDVDLEGRQIARYTGLTPMCFATINDASGVPVRVNNGAFIISGVDNPDFQDKYYNGDVVGYIETPLTYPGELIGAAGDNVASVLDKIKNTLGNYEWFYDTDGDFHFRRIPNFLSTGNTPLNLTPKDDAMLNAFYAPVYNDTTRLNEFSDSNLVASVSLNPNYSNIKNDFVLWGTKNDNHIVRYHLAIESRPKDTQNSLCHVSIWSVVEKAKPTHTLRYEVRSTTRILPANETWGECVAPALQGIFTFDPQYQFNWREELYRKALLAQGTSTRGSYYDEELLAEWRDLYDPTSTVEKDPVHSFEKEWLDSVGTQWYGYNKDVIKDPTKIRYWLDLIDTDTSIGKFSVQRIGRRSVVKEDNTVECVYNNQINDIVFLQNNYDPNNVIEKQLFRQKITRYNNIGQTFALLTQDQMNYLSLVNMNASCYDLIRSMLYNNLIYNSSISLTCIPIFYLDVNQIIRLNLPQCGLQGDFVINNINWQIGNTQTMSLSLSEAITIA